MRLQEPTFDKAWFEKHQERLLRFANSWAGRMFFRLDKVGLDKVRIMEIGTGHICHSWKIVNGRVEKTAEFFTSPRFQRRFQWVYAHAKRFIGAATAWKLMQPQGAFGFLPALALTTSTFYSAAGSNSPVDGYTRRTGVDESFGTLRGGAGNDFSNTFGTVVARLRASSTATQYQELYRSISCFDTSSLTAGATISAAKISAAGSSKFNDLLSSPSFHAAGATPASASSLENADYGQCQTTSFGSISYANFTTDETTYVDLTLDANGIANISKTGISKFSFQQNDDITNTAPTWTLGGFSGMSAVSADGGGTSTGLKLVVTFTAPVVTVLSLSEAPGIIERFSRIWTAIRGLPTDSATPTDSFSRSWSLSRALNEFQTITETAAGFRFVGAVISEIVAITESLSRTVAWVRSKSDAMTITEAISKLRMITLTLSETVNIIEAVTKGIALIRSLTDSVSIIEYVSFPLNWLKRTKPSTTWTSRTKP